MLMSASVSADQCNTNVDAFVKRIFKGVSLSLDEDDLVALTDIKQGSCDSSGRIYFAAYLTSDISSSNLRQNQPIIFTDVVTNEGGRYNASTGEFTASKTGGHTFFWEFLVYGGGNIWLELQKNDKRFAYSVGHGADSFWEVASKSTIMNLIKGDRVKVVYHIGNGTIYGAHRYTGFSGFSL
ncbi:hypothetical protein FSP39_019644 [Pinctada imbricata]|uniref:C1q domain-containing protein n=1 Tax=Pinctada imbricata TaxID=66713 RepID=A0AA88XXC7_PINIB|nr:hypothetical protein FSP39_019644 [Pinctada imbricata]